MRRILRSGPSRDRRHETAALDRVLRLAAACGGGGGGGSPEPPPPPPPPPPTAGLDARPSNTTCVAPERPTHPTIGLERAFPSLSFASPVALLQAPGDGSRWFVVEQAGRVRELRQLAGSATASTFIDIRDRRCSQRRRAGLLGMAFDPDFATNGRVYLSYTVDGPLRSVLSRFRSLDGGQTLNPTTEEVLLTVPQPYSNHNGGHIAFGPDGYLYLGLGDGGSGGDPQNNAQTTTNLLGAMLRIDVNGAAPYGIPADNPFAANPRCANGPAPRPARRSTPGDCETRGAGASIRHRRTVGRRRRAGRPGRRSTKSSSAATMAGASARVRTATTRRPIAPPSAPAANR
jgi:glucose/arabinose dehydrogenase